jgi:uncharacterized membrane protein (DUF485 family)
MASQVRNNKNYTVGNPIGDTEKCIEFCARRGKLMDTSTVAVVGRRSDASASYAIRGKAERLSDLKRRRRAIVVPLFALSFFFYVGTLVVLSYGPAVVAQRVSGSINVAYLLALLQFASTFLVAVVYAVLAKKLIDPVTNGMASELIEEAAR